MPHRPTSGRQQADRATWAGAAVASDRSPILRTPPPPRSQRNILTIGKRKSMRGATAKTAAPRMESDERNEIERTSPARQHDQADDGVKAQLEIGGFGNKQCASIHVVSATTASDRRLNGPSFGPPLSARSAHRGSSRPARRGWRGGSTRRPAATGRMPRRTGLARWLEGQSPAAWSPPSAMRTIRRRGRSTSSASSEPCT